MIHIYSYLKTRVLPILSSLGLIVKSTKKGYSLPSETTPNGQASPNPSPIDTETHWTRLFSGESPSSIGHEHATIRSELLQARKEARQEAEGEVGRLMWYRSGKEMGKLAAPMDRGFLNRRNGKKRVGKDMARRDKDEMLRRATEPWSSGEQGEASV